MGVGGPVISQLLFFFHVVPSLFSSNTDGPSRFTRLGNASAAMYRRARKDKVYRTRHGLPDPDFSPPWFADARNEILGPEILERPPETS